MPLPWLQQFVQSIVKGFEERVIKPIEKTFRVDLPGGLKREEIFPEEKPPEKPETIPPEQPPTKPVPPELVIGIVKETLPEQLRQEGWVVRDIKKEEEARRIVYEREIKQPVEEVKAIIKEGIAYIQEPPTPKTVPEKVVVEYHLPPKEVYIKEVLAELERAGIPDVSRRIFLEKAEEEYEKMIKEYPKKVEYPIKIVEELPKEGEEILIKYEPIVKELMEIEIPHELYKRYLITERTWERLEREPFEKFMAELTAVFYRMPEAIALAIRKVPEEEWKEFVAETVYEVGRAKPLHEHAAQILTAPPVLSVMAGVTLGKAIGIVGVAKPVVAKAMKVGILTYASTEIAKEVIAGQEELAIGRVVTGVAFGLPGGILGAKVGTLVGKEMAQTISYYKMGKTAELLLPPEMKVAGIKQKILLGKLYKAQIERFMLERPVLYQRAYQEILAHKHWLIEDIGVLSKAYVTPTEPATFIQQAQAYVFPRLPVIKEVPPTPLKAGYIELKLLPTLTETYKITAVGIAKKIEPTVYHVGLAEVKGVTKWIAKERFVSPFIGVAKKMLEIPAKQYEYGKIYERFKLIEKEIPKEMGKAIGYYKTEPLKFIRGYETKAIGLVQRVPFVVKGITIPVEKLPIEKIVKPPMEKPPTPILLEKTLVKEKALPFPPQAVEKIVEKVTERQIAGIKAITKGPKVILPTKLEIKKIEGVMIPITHKVRETVEIGTKLKEEIKQTVRQIQTQAQAQFVKQIQTLTQPQAIRQIQTQIQTQAQILKQAITQEVITPTPQIKIPPIVKIPKMAMPKVPLLKISPLKLVLPIPKPKYPPIKPVRVIEPEKIKPKTFDVMAQKTLLSDLISVTRTQLLYGKAIHPKPTKKLWEIAKRTLYLYVPTLEMLRRKKRK